MSAHTPGPWEAVNDEIVAFNSDVNVADVRLWDGINPTEWQANMRLIAAAPDMLETCRRVADWLTSFSMPPTSTIAEKQEHLALLEATILKATGGQA